MAGGLDRWMDLDSHFARSGRMAGFRYAMADSAPDIHQFAAAADRQEPSCRAGAKSGEQIGEFAIYSGIDQPDHVGCFDLFVNADDVRFD